MPLPRVIPALADLTQDIAGPVPVQLLRDWATGEQDPSAAEALLSPFQVQGAVVASDTSGLTRLTQESDLLDVLSLISRPKEIVHALGREIGGRAIGTWVADNTKMLYPAGLELEMIVEAMSEAQARIQERLPVRIGMCIHSGSFFEIGGGLYGTDADTVEYLAEQCAGPGEILLTGRVVRQLKSLGSGEGAPRLFPKTLPREHSPELVFVVQSNRRAPWLQETETFYPHPFPPDFYGLLSRLGESLDVEEIKRRIYEQWLRERTVVFLARHRGPLEARSPAPSLDGLLDDLVMNALMDTVIREMMSGRNQIASSGGGIAILTFDTPQEGIGFARDLRAKLAENGLPVQVAIDAGPVLLFQNSRGPSGIAGDPINVASKLAEDVGKPGCIRVTERAFTHPEDASGQQRFEVTLSGITLKGVILN